MLPFYKVNLKRTIQQTKYLSKQFNHFNTRQSIHKMSPNRLIIRASFATGPNRQKPDENEEKKTLVRRIFGVGSAGALLLGKTKWIFAAAKLTKFASVFSMLATTGTYALFFGWPFAVGLVGQLALHESVNNLKFCMIIF